MKYTTISGGPLSRIKLEVSGDAALKQAFRGGIYYLAPDEINGKKYWYSKNGQQAIWWSNEGFWLVGLYEDLGSSSTNGIRGPSDQDTSPTRIYSGWMYSDFYFKSATKGDIKFVDISHQEGKPNENKYNQIRKIITFQFQMLNLQIS